MIEIFYAYAHEDEELRKKLDKHLSILRRDGLIKGWHDRDINAGEEWKREIAIHLNTAQIILLLISSDFLASDYCYSVEMRRAIERHKTGEACVIPIILRPTANAWKRTPFGQLKALPTDGKPVDSSLWHNHDEAFADIADGIEKVVREFLPLEGYPDHVSQSMRERYSQLDEAISKLGVPKRANSSDIKQKTSQRGTHGYKWSFTKGAIYWCERGGAQPIYGEIGDLYHNRHGVADRLGFPLTDEFVATPSHYGTEGKIQRFEDLEDCPGDVITYPAPYGASIYHSRYGTHPTWGWIGFCYERLGGTGGMLGFPTSPEKIAETSPQAPRGTTGWYQHFEGGMIVCCVEHGAIPVLEPISTVYNKFGGSWDKFGFPIAPMEQDASDPSICFQEFEGGIICVTQR